MKQKSLLLLPFLFMQFHLHAADNQGVTGLENRLLPYLLHGPEQKKIGGLQRHLAIATPSLSDLRAMARNWKQLSPGFRKIYLSSIEIPSNSHMYPSPGFGIEIYYSTDGNDAVDSTDTTGFSTADWHTTTSGKNGVPDYIDQVAFAIDSVWNMEVVHFGFPKPAGYTSASFTSARYKVRIAELSRDEYGITWPFGPDQPSDSGFASMIVLRNHWQGWNDDTLINYETHPEKGLRITFAHEFFHAIQYRMANEVINDYLIDDFPLSWLEGTASMMEDICFPDINDYTQYAIDYFSDPSHFCVFGTSEDLTVYSHSVICLYIYNHLGGIDFFRTAMTRSMTATLQFSDLLSNVCAQYGTSPVDLFNSFHAASFYTGLRTRTDSPVADAAMLPQWSYTTGEGNLNENTSTYVRPSSMRCISFVNNDHPDGALRCSFMFPESSGNRSYALRILLRDTENASSDSIVIPLTTATDTAIATIHSWNRWDEALAIITNGSFTNTLPVVVRFEPGVGSTTPPQHHAPVLQTAAQQDANIYLINGRLASLKVAQRSSGLHIARSNGKFIRKLLIN